MFRVGDRVALTNNVYVREGFHLETGDTGTVCNIARLAPLDIGVRWDRGGGKPPFHACGGACEDGYGWWVSSGSLIFEAQSEAELDELDLNQVALGEIL